MSGPRIGTRFEDALVAVVKEAELAGMRVSG
jgi:hypothetical protein